MLQVIIFKTQQGGKTYDGEYDRYVSYPPSTAMQQLQHFFDDNKKIEYIDLKFKDINELILIYKGVDNE